MGKSQHRRGGVTRPRVTTQPRQAASKRIAPHSGQPDPSEEVWPYGLIAAPHPEDPSRKNVTIHSFKPCRRKDMTPLSQALFALPPGGERPAPYALVVGYVTRIDPQALLAALAAGSGVEGVRGCAEIRLSPTEVGPDGLQSVTLRVREVPAAPPTDALGLGPTPLQATVKPQESE